MRRAKDAKNKVGSNGIFIGYNYSFAGKLWQIGRLSVDNAIISRKGVKPPSPGWNEEISRRRGKVLGSRHWECQTPRDFQMPDLYKHDNFTTRELKQYEYSGETPRMYNKIMALADFVALYGHSIVEFWTIKWMDYQTQVKTTLKEKICKNKKYLFDGNTDTYISLNRENIPHRRRDIHFPKTVAFHRNDIAHFI